MGMFGQSLQKILGLILIIVVLPIFAGLGMLSVDHFSFAFILLKGLTVMSITASAGIVSMGDIIIQFMPLFGIGAEIIGLSFLIANMARPRFLDQLSQNSDGLIQTHEYIHLQSTGFSRWLLNLFTPSRVRTGQETRNLVHATPKLIAWV